MNEFEDNNKNSTDTEQQSVEQSNALKTESSAAITQDVSGNDGDFCKRCVYSAADGTPSSSDYCATCANNEKTKKENFFTSGNAEEANNASQFGESNPYSKTTEFNENGKGRVTPFENGNREGLVTAYPENEIGKGKGFAIASLVLGILSIVCCCLPSSPILMILYIALPVLALVFGIISVKKGKNGIAIAGIVTGSVGLFFALLVFVLGLAVGSDEITKWLESLEESMESELGSTDPSGDTGVIDAIKMLFRK